MNRYENHMINTLRQAADLCEQVGLTSPGIAADTYQMDIEEADLAKALNGAARWIRHYTSAIATDLSPAQVTSIGRRCSTPFMRSVTGTSSPSSVDCPASSTKCCESWVQHLRQLVWS
jgi:hypothetical protein